MAFGMTLVSLVPSRVVALLKRCACGAAARSLPSFLSFPETRKGLFFGDCFFVTEIVLEC